MDKTTVSPTAAAELLGISAQLLRYRATRGEVRVARRSPMRFRLADVVDYRATMRPPDGRRGRPRHLRQLTENLLT
jgi:hypothetical protein